MPSLCLSVCLCLCLCSLSAKRCLLTAVKIIFSLSPSRSRSLTSHASFWLVGSRSPGAPGNLLRHAFHNLISRQKRPKTRPQSFQTLLSDGSKNHLLLVSFQKPFSYVPRVFLAGREPFSRSSRQSASPRFPQSNFTPKATKNSSSELPNVAF